MPGIARKLAAENFAVFAMDYRGFGLSQGLHGYIPCFDLLVDDVCEHYSLLKSEWIAPLNALLADTCFVVSEFSKDVQT